MHIEYGDEQEQMKDAAPVRALLIAVLERAMRDLEAGSYKDTLSAITWITCPRAPEGEEECFSFALVCEVLDINKVRLAHIHEAVAQAQIRREKLAPLRSDDRKRRGMFPVTDSNLHFRVPGCMGRKQFPRRRVLAA